MILHEIQCKISDISNFVVETHIQKCKRILNANLYSLDYKLHEMQYLNIPDIKTFIL